MHPPCNVVWGIFVLTIESVVPSRSCLHPNKVAAWADFLVHRHFKTFFTWTWGEMERSGLGWHGCNSVEILAGKNIHPSGKDIHLYIYIYKYMHTDVVYRKKCVLFLRYIVIYICLFPQMLHPLASNLDDGSYMFSKCKKLWKNFFDTSNWHIDWLKTPPPLPTQNYHIALAWR